MRGAAAGLMAATALTVAAAAAALAQEPGMGSGPAASGPGAHRDGDPAEFRARMQAHRQEKLQALRQVLRLRPDQDAAFQAFAQAVAPLGGGGWKQDGQDRAGAGAGAAATTPQRLDMLASRLSEREARMRRRIEATRAFYAALDPQQQRVFDSLMELRGHGGGLGGHGMEHGDRRG